MNSHSGSYVAEAVRKRRRVAVGARPSVSHETFRLLFSSRTRAVASPRRVAAEGRHPRERRTRARARDDEPPRKDAALLHLPPTSKPNMSNSPCVATSTRLLRSFAGGRALRSARCGAASAAALEGVGRASALGMASARTIAASIPMRRSRRNIEEGGSPVVQSVVGGRCFATVQCGTKRAVEGSSRSKLAPVTRDGVAHTRAREPRRAMSADVSFWPPSRVSRPGRRHGKSRNARLERPRDETR
jgi:hypothetical protein